MHYGIIAAGEGSRLVSEGVARPKPLVLLNGEPMIGRLISLFLRCEAESVAVIVNEQMTEVADYLRTMKVSLPVPMEIVVKSTPSSMHSFYELSSLMEGKGKFVITTVDTIFREDDFHKYVDAFAKASDDIDGVMPVTSFIDDEKPLYVETDDALDILAFRDAPWPGVEYISGGIYGLTSPSIPVLRECMANGVSRMRNYQRALVAAGLRLKAFPFSKIVDVDHAGDIRMAESFISQTND